MSRYGVDEAIGGLLDDALIGVDRRARAVEAASVAPTPRYGGSLSEDDDDVPLAARVGGGVGNRSAAVVLASGPDRTTRPTALHLGFIVSAPSGFRGGDRASISCHDRGGRPR